jgi:hypothetical protein
MTLAECNRLSQLQEAEENGIVMPSCSGAIMETGEINLEHMYEEE